MAGPHMCAATPPKTDPAGSAVGRPCGRGGQRGRGHMGGRPGAFLGLGKAWGVPSEVPQLLILDKTLLREVAVLVHPQRTE